MATFEALEIAFQLATALGRVLGDVTKHDRDLAQQLRRAAASVPSCLSEGAQRYSIGGTCGPLDEQSPSSLPTVRRPREFRIAAAHGERRARREART